MIPICLLAIENEEDRQFMTDIFLEYQKLMYREIFRILRNEWDTEDVLQITLVRLIDKIPELREKESAKLVNYVITACKNNAYNYLRDHKRGCFSFDDYCEVDWAECENSVELRLIAEDEIQLLAERWPQLDERSRILLEGKYVLGKSDDELAAELRIKPSSVRMALTRARKSAYKIMSK